MIRASHDLRQNQGRYADHELPENHARAISDSIKQLTDLFFEDLDPLLSDDVEAPKRLTAGSGMAEYLPPQHLRRYSTLFVKKFLGSLIVVGWKLGALHVYQLACVAEELAMRALIERAKQNLRERGERADFGRFRTAVFADEDFEDLFDPRKDGFEKLGELETANLAFQDWFKPFQAGSPVHPLLGDED